MKYILLDSSDIGLERELYHKLLNQGLISDYNGISKLFLSQNEQQNLQHIFRDLSQNKAILELYTKLGFTKYEIQQHFLEIANMKINNIDKNPLASAFYIDNKLISQPKDFMDNETSRAILASFGAEFIDFGALINAQFNAIKINAIYLKIIALFAGLLILGVFLGMKKSCIIMGAITLSSAISVSILVIFGNALNIFSIFGLILASAIGVDYMLIALNSSLKIEQKIFGIALCALTSLISFIMLCFSQTAAIVSFGLSVSLCMGICAGFAIILARKF